MHVREAVFIQEQNVPPDIEHDSNDIHFTHVKACLEDGTVIGTARLSPNGYIGRMAVLKNHRGSGVGTALLQMLLEESRRQQLNTVCLNAQVSAIFFYQQQGFVSEGKTFMEAGIEHCKMCLNLT